MSFLILLTLMVCRLSAANVSLAWSASGSPGVVGYVVHYGTLTGVLPQRVDVGNQTTATIPNLTSGTTYYFTVTAYVVGGVESLPSNEVSYTAPPPVSLSMTSQGPRITFPSSLAKAYRVVYKNNLSDTQWLNGSSILIGTDLPLQWTDTGATTNKQRFYTVVLLP